MSNITLIGMPGAGKSTIGVILAKTLCRSFVDTDLLIQQDQNCSLQIIIDYLGLEAFREIEERVICSINVSNHVIATGGSVVYSEKAMEHLRSISTVFFLDVPLEELEKRIRPMMLSRGIVMRKGATLKDLYEERLPLYRKYAHHTVVCQGGHCMEKMVHQISGQINSIKE